MTPTDLAQRTYLEQRLEALLDSRLEVMQAALQARTSFAALPTNRLCPKEVARLERRVIAAEQRSLHLARAITAIGAELKHHIAA